jgi:hypothetical protein
MQIELPVYATLALAAGPFFFIQSFRHLRLRRLIQNTPTAHIRSMAMGLVELKGKIVQRSEHSAPFSGRPCAYWEVDVATRGRRNGWTIVHRNTSGSPFFIEDGTGLALVYPKGAECRVRHQVEENCMGISLPDCYARYLDEQHLAFSFVWRLSSLRFRERILEEGQEVYLLGSAEPRAHVVDISQEAIQQATGTDGLRTNRVRTLQQEAVAVVRRGKNDPVFVISQDSERELAFELGLKMWGFMLAGPALTLFGLGYWLYHFASGIGPK